MHRNQELYQHLKANIRQISDIWYSRIEDTDPESVYSSKDPVIVEELKEMNLDFLDHLFRIFIEEEQSFFAEFKKWSQALARDQKHYSTPIQYIVREYVRLQDVVMEKIKEFFYFKNGEISIDRMLSWYDLVVRSVNLSVFMFIEEANKITKMQLEAQSEMINELSSPVILLQNKSALLPLIGDIDTSRAKLILENTLKECSEKNVDHLCIDLSGVVMIDTMVAHEIFNLIKTLKLVGVSSTLSGIRPEIAQTAVQLGIPFYDISIASSLADALNSIKR
ncbi:STAS domain-containing protein [Metabacillus sp. GX 13764]|uniref:STAS domain-containing protein n=1 Tax=Metabacillus kandeliae TaxID=2900151 RepID=UPI001E28C2DA|nr:STAS domain-containing protein [Metabacillus kandeliae]MCD7036686.1 STAS domain-containing protein [Metabacillus kandeliae]